MSSMSAHNDPSCIPVPFCRSLLNDITEMCTRVFQESLIGIYLHGSLAMGCFNPAKSDIDLIVVVKSPPSDTEKLAFMNSIVELDECAPAKGIEISIVQKRFCNVVTYPTPYELHFSNMHLQWFLEDPQGYIRDMHGTDKDLAAHFMMINKSGILLYGEEIAKTFANIPRTIYLDSIWSDIEHSSEDVLDDPVYVILNLCRTMAYVHDNQILSKEQGGLWALHALPERDRPLIATALSNYRSEGDAPIDVQRAQSFATTMADILKSAIRKQISAY